MTEKQNHMAPVDSEALFTPTPYPWHGDRLAQHCVLPPNQPVGGSILRLNTGVPHFRGRSPRSMELSPLPWMQNTPKLSEEMVALLGFWCLSFFKPTCLKSALQILPPTYPNTGD